MMDHYNVLFLCTGIDARLRRAQAFAINNGVGLEICRQLIRAKLEGQERLAADRLNDSLAVTEIAKYRDMLPTADTFESLRSIEARAASSYFRGWKEVPVIWPKVDLLKIPDHWRRAGSRQSPLSGAPRLAVTPVHAVLNYSFALVEAEARSAVSALGLDACLGLGLHADTPGRDSLVFDVIEPVRPQVEAWVLDWIMREPFRRIDFFETPTGCCRLKSHLCARLAETGPIWAKLVAPWAEWIAQSLWNEVGKRIRDYQMLPTRLTHRKKSLNKHLIPLPALPNLQKTCLGCGASVRRGQHCHVCATQISREALITSAKIGRIAAHSDRAQEQRKATQLRHAEELKLWTQSRNEVSADADIYTRTIQPALGSITNSQISTKLGVSLSYAADIRAGRRRPHPRHWQALAGLAGFKADEASRT